VLPLRRSLRVFLALAFSACLPQLSLGAEAGLFMAGTEMKLGMPEESLVAKLKESYKLTSAGERGWLIFETNGPPYKYVGSIAFTRGRLSDISKEWGSFNDGEAVSFAKELFSLLSSVANDKVAPALVRPRVEVRQPGLIVSVIELRYPGRTISISVVESRESGNSVSLMEALETE